MTLLKQANAALRDHRLEAAIPLYIQALQENPAISNLVSPNLKLARQRWLKARATTERPRVVVCGWDLACNAAGRVATLAQIYETLADVEIIGCLFQKKGTEIWQPIRNIPLPIHPIRVTDERQFLEQATEQVLRSPCDLLHLSKPRFPNILIGLLYKLIWGSHVVVDIDDEELAFVSTSEPLALEEYLHSHHYLPNPAELAGKDWTRIAVGLAKAFDGVTVVNQALQQRYGGLLLRHARDENHFKPSTERRRKSREKLDIPLEQKVVLFLGTPRAHKGIRETALAIAQLKQKDVLFLIVGNFPPSIQWLKTEIEAMPGLKSRLLGDQPFDVIPDIVATGDICVLLQDPDSLAAQYQTPAKLSDALAMGLTVLAEPTPALSDLADQGAFTPVNRGNLLQKLEIALTRLDSANCAPVPHPAFVEHLSLAANRTVITSLLQSLKHSKPHQLNASLMQLADRSEFGPLLPALIGKKPENPRGLEQINRLTMQKPMLTVNVAGKSIDEVIELAQEAMRQDDWTEAYLYWKSLMDRSQKELTIPLLLRISHALFKLDAFSEATVALKRAEKLDPKHPGVIREQAGQYYYHCYSSWLMLVTENEPDWYKTDGLEKRPDWKTACDLIEKAENVAPRNNLRRYVQAYLLLAEEAWDKQKREEAHTALRIALDAIGPHKITQPLNQAILEAVDLFRDGRVDGNAPNFQTLQDEIKALPIDLLNVQDWLCLNDILNWNGLLHSGYVSREKAVDLAITQGKENPKKKDILKTALKAALDRNNKTLIDEFLGNLKKICPDAIDVRELESCCELMNGNLETFRQKWPHPASTAEHSFRKYINHKTVGIVGPGYYSEDHLDNTRDFDVHVRINWRNNATDNTVNPKKTKIDVTLYNAHSARLMLTKPSISEHLQELDFCLIRRQNSNFQHTNNSRFAIRKISEYPGSLYKSLNAIPAMLFDCILNGSSRVKIYNADFYSRNKHHHAGYRNTESHIDNLRPKLRNLQPVMANHDLIGQIKMMRNLANKSIIELDARLSEVILSWSDQNYISTVFSNLISNLKNESKHVSITNQDSKALGNLDKSELSNIDTSRPVALVLNGPSATQYNIDDLSDNAVFGRCNFFHKEVHPRYGRKVDYYFWSVNNPILNSDIAELVNNNTYHLQNLCTCVPAFQLDFSRTDVNPLPLLNQQIIDHWKVIMRNVELGRFLASRPLPTTGVQAIAFFAVLGFRNFEIVGMDFYQGSERYMYTPSAEMKEKMDKKHFTPGYEKGAHTLDLDVSFLIEILRQYPDVKIKNIANNKIINKIINREYPKHVAYDNLASLDSTAKNWL